MKNTISALFSFRIQFYFFITVYLLMIIELSLNVCRWAQDWFKSLNLQPSKLEDVRLMKKLYMNRIANRTLELRTTCYIMSFDLLPNSDSELMLMFVFIINEWHLLEIFQTKTVPILKRIKKCVSLCNTMCSNILFFYR